ncbi:MAG: AsmA-like C-terminal region-containing protein [Candidatus Eiseniibacteriota bacterium]
MEAEAPVRSPLRVVLWVVAALVALVLVTWGALALFLPPAKVRELVSARAASVLARDVRFADVTLGLWPPVRLTVRRPALAEPGGFAHGAALQARSVHLDLDLLALLSRRIVVRRLVIDRPALHLALRPDGTSNLDGILKPPGDRKPAGAGEMSLEIRELRIQDGRVLVDDLKTARRTAFDLESRISLEAEPGGARFATAGETVFSSVAFGPLDATRLADLNRSLEALEWRLVHDGKFDAKQKRLALSRLGLRLGRAEFALVGVIDDPGPRARMNLRAQGSGVDLGELLDYLAAAEAKAVHGIRGGGRLDFDLHIAGSPGPRLLSSIDGTVRIADGTFRYPDAPAGIDALGFTARFAPDSLTIGDLRARVGGQPVRATLFATRFADPWVRFAVQGDLDLAAIAPLLAPKDTKLTGRAAVDVRGSGRAKDPGDLALAGGARLVDVSVQSPALPNRIEGVRGDIRFTPARASVTGFAARAGKSSIALEATAERPLALLSPPPPAAGTTASGPPRTPIAPAVVSFNAASSYLDLAEFLPTTPGAPILPNATGEGRVTVARLRSQKLDVQDVAARVRLEPGVLAVPEFSMRAYGGTALGNARFDMRDPARPSYAVKTQVDSLEADAILSAWTPVKGLLHGSFTSTLDLSGAGLTPDDLKRTITAVGLALVANGTFGPGPALEAVARYTRVPALKQLRFKDARLPFRIERGRVVTDPVVFDGPNGEWRLIGSVGFDGTLDYAVSATLPQEVVQRLGATSALAAGALADPQGRMFLDLRLTGKASAPQVAWDGGAMRDRLAGRASQALEAQRAKLESESRAAAEARLVAAQDSARAVVDRARRAAADSLRRRAGDALKGFFGGARDTTQQP